MFPGGRVSDSIAGSCHTAEAQTKVSDAVEIRLVSAAPSAGLWTRVVTDSHHETPQDHRGDIPGIEGDSLESAIIVAGRDARTTGEEPFEDS